MNLRSTTVLEVGEYVAVPYAGKLFSDLGADVIKLEPPAGDVARRVEPFDDERPELSASGFFGYLNTGKRSVTIPESGSLAGDVVRDLVDGYGVDVVLEEGLRKYGVDPRTLAGEHEQLTVISVTGFGATGPWQEYDAPDLVAWAESGHMNKTGYPDSPPVRPRIKVADYWTGHVAAISAFSALLYRDLQGEGGQWVDVPKREAALSTMDRFIAGYSWSGATTERSGFGYPSHGGDSPFRSLYETADGYITAHPTTGGRWETFCREFLERPELIEDERFRTQAAREENRERLVELVEEYTSEREKWDLFERFQEAGIPSGVTSTPEDLVGFEHLREREFWQEIPLPNGESVTMPGFPFRPGGPTSPVRMERAPRLGEHTAEVYEDLGYQPRALLEPASGEPSRGWPAATATTPDPESSEDGALTRPLDGIRVADFSWVYAGPHTTKFLSALGADVVKVESEQKPDSSRMTGGYQYDLEPTSNTSAAYNERNQGKRSLRLDLTTEEGRETALELVAAADVVIENFSPTFMDRVDLSYEDIREVNPEIVYLSMPGIAKSGPAKGYRTYGLTLQSLVGLDSISGFPDDPPTTAGFSLPDPTAGYVGSIAILSGLYHRTRTGEGTFIELPQLEMAASLLHKPLMEYTMNGRMPERVGARDEDYRYLQGVYPCRGEDRWVAIAIENDSQWERFCELLGQPDLASDARFSDHYARIEHHDEVDGIIESWTRNRSREEVRHLLRRRDVPAGIVADEADLLEYDPQLRTREYFTVHDHPEVGTHRYQGIPFRMEKTSVEFGSRAPLFGEHTAEVLEEWLGYTPDEIDEKEGAGALY